MPTAFESQRTVDLEGVLRFVDRLYAAGCAETSWDRPLEEVCRLGGYAGCALTSVDPLLEPRAVLRASHGLSARAATGAGVGRLPRNPLLTDDVLRSRPGTVWHDRRIMSPGLLASTPYWSQWMQPNGFASWACVILGEEGSHVVCLEVYHRPGETSRASPTVDLLAQLAPHLARAWRLGQTIRSLPQRGVPPRAVASPAEGQPAASPATEVAGTAAIIRLRAAFGLSKAEARLALHLAAGASLASMAQAFDVKLTTVRSQLQQVFSKTGTSRQAELVALLLSHGYAGSLAPLAEPASQRPVYSSPAL
jgi:DNA-binding CsgD family transcriptional regulator